METQNSNIEKVFREMRDSQNLSLQQEINDIDELINKRDVLHKEIFNDLDEVKTILRNQEIDAGVEPSRLADIRRKSVDLEELKIQEKLNHWRDIADLKKELRERMKEFRDSQNKTNLLDSLIE